MKLLAATGAVLSAAAMCLAPEQAPAAGKYDGSAPMICGVLMVTECGSDDKCL